MAQVPYLDDGQAAVIPLTAPPTGKTPQDTTLVGAVFSPAGGNALQVFGHCSAGAGSLILFRSLGTGSTEWYPVDLDSTGNKELPVDNAKPVGAEGFFSGTWMSGDVREGGAAVYCVVALGGPTLDKLYVGERRL